jgi:hypothetical protein
VRTDNDVPTLRQPADRRTVADDAAKADGVGLKDLLFVQGE